jgi:histidine ammonia-lyase
MPRTLLLTGQALSRQEFHQVVLENRRVALAPRARAAMQRSRALVEKLIARKEVVYGVTTGFGALATEHIAPEQARALQLNLVRSHACGVGDPLSEAETRGILLLRANALARGLSGVRPLVVEQLCQFLNRGVHPVVPSRGSVGASGDLAPLAHIALALVGEGEVVYRGRLIRAARALEVIGARPLALEAKEGIALLNGTQGMLSLGLLALHQAEILVATADIAGALSLDVLRGSIAPCDPRFHLARPHPGALITAGNITRVIRGSSINASHRNCGRVQDAYSLRCMPQVHGAVRDALAFAARVFEIEMNSATDNPLVFADQGDVISGGNFHGQPLATALDLMAIALTQLGGVSERRIDRMVNPLTSELPPFLTEGHGLQSGFMMAQVTAAALASENRILAHPASVDSIPTSGNKEDYVSMGMTAALRLRPLLRNVETILAIELLAASQALDLLAPLRTGKLGEAAKARVRKQSRRVTSDRRLDRDIARIAASVSTGDFARLLAPGI